MFLVYPALAFYLRVAILQNLFGQYEDTVFFPVYIHELPLN